MSALGLSSTNQGRERGPNGTDEDTASILHKLEHIELRLTAIEASLAKCTPRRSDTGLPVDGPAKINETNDR